MPVDKLKQNDALVSEPTTHSVLWSDLNAHLFSNLIRHFAGQVQPCNLLAVERRQGIQGEARGCNGVSCGV